MVIVSGLKYLVKIFSCVKFEQLIEDLVKRIIVFCEKVMKVVGFLKSDIDEIILVGGLICIFVVQEVVEKFFGKVFSKGVNLDEVVVIGVVI